MPAGRNVLLRMRGPAHLVMPMVLMLIFKSLLGEAAQAVTGLLVYGVLAVAVAVAGAAGPAAVLVALWAADGAFTWWRLGRAGALSR
ncbi:hypothetical protein [Nonomuraea sp. NPDC050643]|uniref:hypothetical protein n=1 Tax=Nonomuraea sp. NPDC050643 TaxID=3155660 RepID=UPI0033FE32C1